MPISSSTFKHHPISTNSPRSTYQKWSTRSEGNIENNNSDGMDEDDVVIETDLIQKMETSQILEDSEINEKEDDESKMELIDFSPQPPQKREEWNNKFEFILSTIGYAVGLGNIWRFPYLCYKSGGGAFLIPFLILLILCGLPLLYLEYLVGQVTRLGPVGGLRKFCPFFQGVGIATVILAFFLSTYYNVILTWDMFLMVRSWKSKLIWSSCDELDKVIRNFTQICWDSNRENDLVNLMNDKFYFDYAIDNVKKMSDKSIKSLLSTMKQEKFFFPSNITIFAIDYISASSSTSPSIEFVQSKTNQLNNLLGNLYEGQTATSLYFDQVVLQKSGNFFETISMRHELIMLTIAIWLVIYLSICKGIKLTGKIVYFTALFPYVVLTVLVVRGCTLQGAKIGLKWFFLPNWYLLTKPEIWLNAATQVFNSIGISFGSLIAMASYNKPTNNCLFDATILILVDALTSIYGGVAVFTILGEISYRSITQISDVAISGPTLVFSTVPEGLAHMGRFSSLWTFLFLFMLFLLGIDSQFGNLEAVITSVRDELGSSLPKILRRSEILILFIIVICFICGLPNFTHAGVYFFTLIDFFSASISLMIIAFCEVILIVWIYGAQKFANDAERVTGMKVPPVIVFIWKYISPVIVFSILIFSFSKFKMVQYGKYVYPPGAVIVGWLIAFSSIVVIPIGAYMATNSARGNTLKEKITNALFVEQVDLD
ncbi:hypothetical protein SNEBB_009202 [Seison nebaliae]|nr:hypothetical protein SNEBB_009202 [Seison nebaliae]